MPNKVHHVKKVPVRVRVARAVTVFFFTLLAILLLAVSLLTVLLKGPSETARDLTINTLLETSALKEIPRLYFSNAVIEKVKAANAIVEGDTHTTAETFKPVTAQTEELKLEDVTGSTFKGKILTVRDPSRVSIAMLDSFSATVVGKKVEEFATDNNAVAAVNGGGFYDPSGDGKGGLPTGILIRNGKLEIGALNTEASLVGFNRDHHLIVGKMTGKEALAQQVVEAISFGPALIVNGVPLEVSGTSGGVNPRTVIGQRADGAIMLLTIDGRQAHSLGATFKDCIDVMLDHGAVNAGNLDGGSSTVMYYNGKVVNHCVSLLGSRHIPTAVIVK